MAQKVNSLNLRLNKRLNWNTILCVHNFNDFCNQVINTAVLLTTNKKIMFDLKMLQNAMLLTKTSKNYKINCKIVNSHFFFFLIKIICTGKKSVQNFFRYHQSYLQIFRSVLKIFLLNQRPLLFHLVNMETQKTFSKYKTFKSQFLTLSPKIFTEFAKNQIAATSAVSLTSSNFNKSLQKSLLTLIEIILRAFKYDILGLKIICQGKWRKTNTGRKQKVYLKFGQIQSSNLANKVVYDSISQKTKYGVCSIKIWIAHKI